MMKWKKSGRRGFSVFLTLALCLNALNLTAFAEEMPVENSEKISAESYDLKIELPPADSESGMTYPMPMDGFGDMLMTEYPKGEFVPGGTWSVEGAWEDGSPVMTIDLNSGEAEVYEPAGKEAIVTVVYSYEEEEEVKAPAEKGSKLPDGTKDVTAESTAAPEATTAPEAAKETEATAEAPEETTTESGETAETTQAPEESAEEETSEISEESGESAEAEESAEDADTEEETFKEETTAADESTEESAGATETAGESSEGGSSEEAADDSSETAAENTEESAEGSTDAATEGDTEAVESTEEVTETSEETTEAAAEETTEAAAEETTEAASEETTEAEEAADHTAETANGDAEFVKFSGAVVEVSYKNTGTAKAAEDGGKADASTASNAQKKGTTTVKVKDVSAGQTGKKAKTATMTWKVLFTSDVNLHRIAVADEAGLEDAFDGEYNLIVLDESFSVCRTIDVTREVTLDLKGQTLTWNNENSNNSSLFRVEEGGVLTITDSSDTVGYTVDYDVVRSKPNGGGATKETEESRMATAKGGTITLQKEIMTGAEENLSAIITVDGGKLVMKNGVINGHEKRFARGVLVDKGGSVFMEGGAIIHCAARAYGNPYGSGIFVRDGSLSMSGGVIGENGKCNFYDDYRRGGGIGLRNGSLDIRGGVITCNETGVGGGIGAEGGSGDIVICGEAVIAGNSTLYSGGGGVSADGSGYTVAIRDGALITKNIAKNWGGGINTGGSALLKVEGGEITGNEAHTGGGINTDNLLMTGGVVAGNTARGNTGGDTDGNGEGGGIRVGGGKGEITGGYITNNETRTTIDWGGGGMFISQGAAMKIQNLLVTDNTAQGLGGGIGGCSTGNVAISATDGLASFGNKAEGNKENGAHAAHKWQDQAALKNDDFLYYGSNDFFCAHSSYVSDAMLGGGSANWHGSQDTGEGYRGNSAENGEIDVWQLAIPKGGAAASQFLMGLSADPSVGDRDKAMRAAKVFITGNESSTHGGGIMCNGTMFIGAVEEKTTEFSSVPVEAKKVYRNTDGTEHSLEGGEFTFALVEEADFRVESGRPSYTKAKARTAVNDGNGKVLFTINDLTEVGEYTYYLVEEPGTGSVIYDPAIYKVEVEVTASQEISWQIDTKFTATVYSGRVTGITAMEINKDGELTESRTVNSAEFVNTYDPQIERQKGSLRIVKSVSGGGTAAAGQTYVFTVTGPCGYSERVSITGSGEEVLKNLEPGLYHVKEEEAPIDGYEWTVTGGGDVIVPENTDAPTTVTITNTYMPEETIPEETTPPEEETTEPETSPEETTPPEEETTEPETSPEETTPPEEETTEPETSPEETTEPETSPEETTEPETSPEETTPPETPEDPPRRGGGGGGGNPPRTNIPEESVPLTEVPDAEVPLAGLPNLDEMLLTEIPDSDIPLAGLPKTGDDSHVWKVLFLLSGAGLALLALLKKKKESHGE